MQAALSIAQIADYLGTSRWTVYRVADTHGLTFTRKGQIVAATGADVLRLLDHCRVATPETEESRMTTLATKAPPKLPTLYTLAEVVDAHPALFKLRPLIEAARAGQFEHYRIGNQRLVDVTQLQKLLDSKRVRPAAQTAEQAALDKVRQRRTRARRAA